jgi:homoserine kinase
MVCCRHLRLLHCNVSSGLLWVLARATPHLVTLVVKEAPLAGIGTSGVAAVAALLQLRALALTLEPHVDVSLLAELAGLRWVLDGGWV